MKYFEKILTVDGRTWRFQATSARFLKKWPKIEWSELQSFHKPSRNFIFYFQKLSFCFKHTAEFQIILYERPIVNQEWQPKIIIACIDFES